VTAKKAIEILRTHEFPVKTPQDHDFLNALLLGIECLKWRHELRESWEGKSVTEQAIVIHSPLPGETEDREVEGTAERFAAKENMTLGEFILSEERENGVTRTNREG
jgi:hypothetical protein